MTTLLLHPPAVKPAEPPLGPAILLAALRRRGIDARMIDANLKAFLYLLQPRRLAAAAGPASSTAVKRALRHAPAALALLRSPAAFGSFPRYRTAVEHLNRAFGVYGEGAERLSLGDYSHGTLSEFAPADLERLSAGEESTLFHDYFVNELLPQVAAMKPRTVSLSVNYRHQVLPAFELAGLLRRWMPGLRIVGGGGMFTSWRRTLREADLRFSAFDHIVFGPGEELLPRIISGEGGPDYFLEEGSEIDFRPDFDRVDLKDYFSPLPVLPVGASRGCYWQRCLFCPEAATPTHPYAAHPAADLPDLLLDLRRRNGTTRFHLTDNAVPVAALRRVAARRADLAGIFWHGFVRFEPALLDSGLAEGLAAAGCTMLQLGLESGSQAVLDRLGKGTRLEDAAAILERLHEAGISTYVYVMLGTPGETEEDAVRTLDFLEEHAARISFLNISIMNLPRESSLVGEDGGAEIRSSALLDDGQPLGLYRSFEPATGWGRGEARRFLRRRLLASPAVREIVNRVPPWFTSNHAPFFPPST
ncbi:B12-binding domain-containing radical SAM protein [Desulfuromonas sp. TF]|uniref:B12-binding domain-containing radical SAM protein n=1 Tax=Desulfuromonas sp. TF TaxID=1232410 RepID=UPI0003F5BB0B|nr:B12-binding domain-containing radical SAM protein [Desulfuromonas sp. TF]